MSPMRVRYVTACQQLLALGVVVVALVPATRVISLDVVGVGPGHGIAQPTISVPPPGDPETAPAAGPDASLDASTGASAGASMGAGLRQECRARGIRVAERGAAAAGCRDAGRVPERSPRAGGG